jgi:pentatricopeptide repeat protein
VTYNTLICGLGKKGEIEKAIDFLDDMISNGLEPNVMTCARKVKIRNIWFFYMIGLCP